MKKHDFKRLALLGLASGTAMATQSVDAGQLSQFVDSSRTLTLSGCGANRCNGGNYQAYRSTPQTMYYYDNAAPASGCNATTTPQGTAQPTPPSSGCGGQAGSCGASKGQTAYNQRSSYYYPQQWQAQPTQPQTSCGGTAQPQGTAQPTQPSSSCGGSTPAQGQTAYNQQGNYYYHSQSGCNSRSSYNQGSYYYTQPQSSCGGQSAQQSQGTYYYNAQPQTSCGGQTSYNNNQNTYYPQMWQSTRPAQPQTGCASVAPAPEAPQPQPSDTSSQPQGSSAYMQRFRQRQTADTGKDVSSSMQMTESDLMSQLSTQGKATYQALDASGKALALKMANQACKGHNECKGMNACKTDTNTCAGKGGCAGTAKGAFTDKNLAVKVAAMKMAEKRSKASSSY